jgi:CBS-domain-containing membrane protein
MYWTGKNPKRIFQKPNSGIYSPSILASAHAFEAFRIMYDADLYVLPVIDHEGKYAGCMTRDNLFKYVAENERH